MGVEITNYIIIGYRFNYKDLKDKVEEIYEYCEKSDILSCIIDYMDGDYLVVGHIKHKAVEEDGERIEFVSFASIWNDEPLILEVGRSLDEFVERFNLFDLSPNFDIFYITNYH